MYEQQRQIKQSTISYQNKLYFQNIGNSNITNNHNSNNTSINIVTQTNNINNNNNNTNTNTNTNVISPSIIPQPPITTRVRNRRYKKLLELRKQGFFDEQAIKLRHPLLYYSFVGQYQYDYYGGEQRVNNDSRDDSINMKRVTTANNIIKRGNIMMTNDNNNSNRMQHEQQQYNKQQIGLSTFLSQHLINMQYKHLLDGQMSAQVEQSLTRQNQQNEKQIQEMKGLLCQRKNRQNRLDNGSVYGQYQQNQQHLLQKQQQEQMQMQIQMEEGVKQEQHNINNNSNQIINRANKLTSYTPTQHQINKLKQQHYSYHYYPNNQASSSFRTTYYQHQHQHQQQPDNNHNHINSNNKRILLTLEQRGIQQQHLIEYCEQLFMEGKLNDNLNMNYGNNRYTINNNNNLTQQINPIIMINYDQIDNNSQYDDIEQINRDLQQRYFNQSQSQQQKDQRQKKNDQNNQYQTGVMDY